MTDQKTRKRRQRRKAEYSLFNAVQHKVCSLADALESHQIPRRRIFHALSEALCNAYGHGVQHGINIMSGKPDRKVLL